MRDAWRSFRWLTEDATEIRLLICMAFDVDDAGTVTVLMASLNPEGFNSRQSVTVDQASEINMGLLKIVSVLACAC